MKSNTYIGGFFRAINIEIVLLELALLIYCYLIGHLINFFYNYMTNLLFKNANTLVKYY